MKTLILHAGLHKTGSTSIQESLGIRKDVLEQEGYRYPAFRNPDGVLEYNHSYMFQLAFSNAPSQLAIVKKRGWDPTLAASCYYNQLRVAMEDCPNLILSGEGISRLNELELKKIKELFNTWKINVITYVRPAYSFFCSAQQERIKNGTVSNIVPDRLPNSESDTITRLQRVFNNITFISFSDACRHQLGPAGDFFDRFQLSYGKQDNRHVSNIGLGNIVTRLCAHLNDRLNTGKSPEYDSAKSSFQSPLLAIKEQKFRLCEDELVKIQSFLVEENLKIYELTGLDFRDEVMITSSPCRLDMLQSCSIIWNLSKQDVIIRDSGIRYLRKNSFVHDASLVLLPFLTLFARIHSLISAKAIHLIKFLKAIMR